MQIVLNLYLITANIPARIHGKISVIVFKMIFVELEPFSTGEDFLFRACLVALSALLR